jgi:tetratricopeptide (TPR) repeat protein
VLALGGAYEEIGDVRQCLFHFERALDLARRLKGPAGIVGALGNRARIHYRLADWDRMWDDTTEALQICREMGATSTLPLILYHLGVPCIFRGRWDDADRYMDEAIEVAGAMQATAIIRWANGFAAQGNILRGNPEQARDRLLPLLDRDGVEEQDVSWFLPVLAWAYLEAGDPERARETARHALRRGKEHGDQIVMADALWVSGRIATHAERWEVAEQFFMEGLALTRGNSFRWAEIRTAFEYGCMQARAGRPTEAFATLQEALTEFRRMRAQPYIERTEKEIARLQGR